MPPCSQCVGFQWYEWSHLHFQWLRRTLLKSLFYCWFFLFCTFVGWNQFDQYVKGIKLITFFKQKGPWQGWRWVWCVSFQYFLEPRVDRRGQSKLRPGNFGWRLWHMSILESSISATWVSWVNIELAKWQLLLSVSCHLCWLLYIYRIFAEILGCDFLSHFSFIRHLCFFSNDMVHRYNTLSSLRHLSRWNSW